MSAGVVRQTIAAQANCERCSINGGCRPVRPVLGSGSDEADLVVIGEAPGASEVAQGAPFTGPSGRLLRRELVRLRIPPERVYFTNALACPLPEGSQVKARDIEACRGRLLAELHDLNPRVILCAGASAATVLRGQKSSITHLVGHTEWSEEFQAHLAFTYNPAAVLHEPGMYQDFVWGLRRAMDALDLPDGPREYPPVNTTVATPYNTTAVMEYLAHALEEPVVVCDLETTGLSPQVNTIRSIGFSWTDDFALIIPMDLLNPKGSMFARVHQLLSRREGSIVIGHNYQFDVRFLWHAGFTDAYVGGDTMLLHYVLDERSGKDGGGAHDLKTLARKYCNAPAYAEGIDRAHMAEVPEALMHTYQGHDCVYTFRLYHELLREIHREEPSRHGYMEPLETYTTVLLPAANALARVEDRGVLIDVRKLIELRHHYQEQIVLTRERAEREAGNTTALLKGSFNPNSPVQVAKILYTSVEDGGFGYPVPPVGKGKKLGSRPTDEEAIHFLQRLDRYRHRPPNPLLDTILEYRSLLHTLSTYIDGTANRLLEEYPDGYLRSHFHLPGTTSGRLSSSGPNFQNIPARSVIKELFTARPGYVLVNADYRRLEVGVLAWFSRDHQLIKDFMADDFHYTVAGRVFAQIVEDLEQSRGNLTELDRVAKQYAVFTEIAQRQSRAAERTDDPKKLFDWLKELIRRQAKYVSFGKMYGEGAASLAKDEKGMGVPVEVAAHYSQLWDEMYPQAIQFMSRQVFEAKTYGWLETPVGRRRRFDYPRELARHLANEAMNFPIQSFASDMCLTSLTKLERILPERGLGHVLLTVHDSILFELREDRLEEAMQVVHDVMTTVLTDDDIVFEIDMKVGPNWGKAA